MVSSPHAIIDHTSPHSRQVFAMASLSLAKHWTSHNTSKTVLIKVEYIYSTHISLCSIDTINHRRLLEVYDMTTDRQLICIVRTILEKRRFYVELNGKRNRWRLQRNGLSQGSVVTPLPFNIYMNDPSEHAP